MECSGVALVLVLVLAGQTTDVLPTNDHALVVGRQEMLPPLDLPETLRQLTLCQSPIRSDADEASAEVLSRYDMYYANGLYRGNCENSQHNDGGPVHNSDASGATGTKTPHESPFSAKMRCCILRCMSWLAGYGTTAIARTSICRDDPAERLYVTTCNRNDGIILASLGKLTGEYRLESTRYSTLLGEFYRIDDESCPAFTLNADFATAWQPSVAGANRERKKQEQASAELSIGTWLDYWATRWLGDWNAVFRNISRQIARLDWTVLLTGKSSGLAVRHPAPASSSAAR